MGAFTTAVRWLVRGIRLLRQNRTIARGVAMTVFSNNEKIAYRVERAFAKWERVETKYGQHTDFWESVKTGAKDPNGILMTQDNCLYAMMWKRGFDDTIKPIGKKLLPDEEVAEPPPSIPEIPEVSDLTPEEDDDSNLE